MLTIRDDRLVLFEFDGEVHVFLPDGIVGIGTRAFYEQEMLKSIVVPVNVITIGDHAFAKCTGLETVELQSGLKRLGNGSFQGCTALREVQLPDGVVSIHACAFQNCSAMESIKLPQSLRRNLESHTFANCASLRTINIPPFIQQIKSGAFANCTGLVNVIFENPDIIIEPRAFAGCLSLSTDARAFIEAHVYQDDTIDINSRLNGPAGRLSNYTERHFILDGVECQSIEGVLQSLKCADVDRQREICGLVGKSATRAGKALEWESDQMLYWQGETYPRSSERYKQLISRIYDVAFEQDASFCEDLAAVKGKKLSHRMGRTDPTQTVLTRMEFIAQIERLMGRLDD